MNGQNKTHVCHLVYSFDVGGLERVIANCINALDSERYCHSIIALTNVGGFITEIDCDINTYSLEKKSGNDPLLHYKLYKVLRKIKPDVLHSYNIATIEYHWLASLLGIKIRLHAEHGRDSYDVHGKVKKYHFLRKMMNAFISKFILVSEDLYYWIKDEVGIEEKKLSLITNGIDTDYYQPIKKNLAPTGEFKDKFVFGHVSRLHPIKNQEFLIDSFHSACQNSSEFSDNCVLVIVGDGPEKNKLVQRASNFPAIENKVIFTGAKSNVKGYYSQFDVFVMSSLAEGVPMTLLESMSMGIPHLVTSVGGIKEVVENGITGFSLDESEKSTFPNKMLELFQDKNKLQMMAASSRDRIISRYSQKKMINAYNDLYQKAW